MAKSKKSASKPRRGSAGTTTQDSVLTWALAWTFTILSFTFAVMAYARYG